MVSEEKERELKRQGEELARVAVESGLGSKQLRTMYTWIKTKPLAMVEAYIQHQIDRVSGKEALELALRLLEKHSVDRESLKRVFMYANMLYGYCERQVAMKYSAVAEEGSKMACKQQNCKYVGLDFSTERDQTTVIVKVSGYRGDPKLLAASIEREILHRDPRFLGRIWIEQVDRR